jgi:hypothetical protein
MSAAPTLGPLLRSIGRAILWPFAIVVLSFAFPARWLWRKRRAFAIALVIMVAIHLVATAVTGLMLRGEYARLKKAGEPLTADEVLTPMQQRAAQMDFRPSPDEPNAAWVYEHAFQELRLSDQDKREIEEISAADVRAGDPRRVAFARRVVPRNQHYFALLEEASRIRDCAFPVNWYSGAATRFPHVLRMREGARMLSLRADLYAAEGRVDEALSDCAIIVRMAEHAQSEPEVISQLTSYALDGTWVRALEHALAAARPSAEACQRLLNQLSRMDQVIPSVRAVQGERVLLGEWIFDYIRHKGKDPTLAEMIGKSYLWLRIPVRTIGRPLLNLDQLAYLRSTKAWTDLMRLPWPEAQQREQSLQRELHDLPTYRAVFSKMLVPILSRFVLSRDRVAAQIGAAQVALAVKAYQGEHGAYPTSLAELQSLGWKLPLDSFDRQPYHYRREGQGFVVWSVGPDMTDDGGKPWQRPMKLEEKGYDIVFRCEG